MSTGNIISLLLIGLMAGYLSGLLGIGGGVVIVPALVYFLGFSQPVAQGTSLALFTLPVGLIAASRYYKNGFVDLKAGRHYAHPVPRRQLPGQPYCNKDQRNLAEENFCRTAHRHRIQNDI